MCGTIRLPNGDEIEPGDVILFEGYPYRYVRDTGDVPGGENAAFVLSPVYWGGSDLDLAFQSTADLEERWGPESRGVLTDEEWADWLAEARESETFGDEELDAVARAVRPRGMVDRLLDLLR